MLDLGMKLQATCSFSWSLTYTHRGQAEKLKWDKHLLPTSFLMYIRIWTRRNNYHPCRLPVWAERSFVFVFSQSSFCTFLLRCSLAPTTITLWTMPVLHYYGSPCVLVYACNLKRQQFNFSFIN